MLVRYGFGLDDESEGAAAEETGGFSDAEAGSDDEESEAGDFF